MVANGDMDIDEWFDRMVEMLLAVGAGLRNKDMEAFTVTQQREDEGTEKEEVLYS